MPKPTFLHCLALALLGVTFAASAQDCWRRLNLDSECQSNFDRGLVANS